MKEGPDKMDHAVFPILPLTSPGPSLRVTEPSIPTTTYSDSIGVPGKSISERLKTVVSSLGYGGNDLNTGIC